MPAAFHNQQARNGVKTSSVSAPSQRFKGFEFYYWLTQQPKFTPFCLGKKLFLNNSNYCYQPKIPAKLGHTESYH